MSVAIAPQDPATVPHYTIDLSPEAREAIIKIAKLLPRRKHVPILSNILISARAGVLSIRGTDLETTANFRETTNAEDFSVTVDGKEFAKAIAKAKTVKIYDGSDLSMMAKIDGWVRRFTTLPASDFPELPKMEKEEVIASGTLGAFARGFSLRAFASDEQARGQVLMSVLLEARDGILRFVATDGYRMAVFAPSGILSELGAKHEHPDLIFPGCSAAFVSAFATKKNENARVYLSRNYARTVARVSFGSLDLYVRLVDGQYPNWRQVLPEQVPEHTRAFGIDRKDLIAKAKQAGAVAGDRASMILLTPETREIRISAKNADSGEYEGSVRADIGSPFLQRIAFNAKFLAEVLSAFDSETVSVTWESPITPASWHGTLGGDELRAVLMPLRQN